MQFLVLMTPVANTGQKNAFIAEYEFQSNDWVMSNYVPIYSGLNIAKYYNQGVCKRTKQF